MATKRKILATAADGLSVEHYDNHAFVHFDDLIPLVKAVDSGGGGGGGGTTNYTDLSNKPSINNITLEGNKTLNDLSIPTIASVNAKWDIPTNANELAKWSEDNDGNPTYDGNPISASSYIISDGDIYDETERLIGFYMGKPLYRKVVSCGTLPNATSLSVPVNIANLADVISYRGIALDSTSNNALVMPFVGNPQLDATRGIQISYSNGNLIIHTGMDRTAYIKTYVIIEYTKTTDTPITASYSHPYNYSLDETVVGTWIDGSLLYQRTFHRTGIQAGVTNIADLIYPIVAMEGVFHNNGSNPWNSIFVYANDTSTTNLGRWRAVLYQQNGHISIDIADSFEDLEVWITVKYTKTT